ncbi:MAG: hypothetical protein ACOC2C_04325 [Cyclonatronaceae bacterium]
MEFPDKFKFSLAEGLALERGAAIPLAGVLKPLSQNKTPPESARSNMKKREDLIRCN